MNKQRPYPQDRSQKPSKRNLSEQIKDLQPKQKLPTFQEKQAEFEAISKAKEDPELYAILGAEKILDIQSLEVAKKIAAKINARVWRMVRKNDEVEILYPINFQNETTR